MGINWGPIPNADNLYRHSVSPPSFTGKKFRHAKFWKLFDCADNSVVASVAWERYVPTTALVHKYGCRLASERNAKKRDAGTFVEKDRQIYCGAYRLTAHAVRQLVGTEGLEEVSHADVVHDIENEISHVSLKVFFNSGITDREGTKTVIMDRLWSASSGPLIHICSGDQETVPHPNTTLEDGPAGVCCDTRSCLGRILDLVRFQIHNWIWEKFYRE